MRTSSPVGCRSSARERTDPVRIVVQAGATGAFCEELFTERIALFRSPLLERAGPGIIAVVLRVTLVTWRGQDGP